MWCGRDNCIFCCGSCCCSCCHLCSSCCILSLRKESSHTGVQFEFLINCDGIYVILQRLCTSIIHETVLLHKQRKIDWVRQYSRKRFPQKVVLTIWFKVLIDEDPIQKSDKTGPTEGMILYQQLLLSLKHNPAVLHNNIDNCTP